MSFRDQVKAASDRPRVWIDTPEWASEGESKCGVYVGTMTARAKGRFDVRMSSKKGDDEQRNLENLMAELAIECCELEDGSKAFVDSDGEWLGDKSSLVLKRIFDVAAKINGLTKEDQEEQTKNS